MIRYLRGLLWAAVLGLCVSLAAMLLLILVPVHRWSHFGETLSVVGDHFSSDPVGRAKARLETARAETQEMADRAAAVRKEVEILDKRIAQHVAEKRDDSVTDYLREMRAEKRKLLASLVRVLDARGARIRQLQFDTLRLERVHIEKAEREGTSLDVAERAVGALNRNR